MVDEFYHSCVSDRVGDKLTLFFRGEDSLLFHLAEKLRKLGLPYRTICLEVSYGFGSLSEFAEDEKTFWVSQGFQKMSNFR